METVKLIDCHDLDKFVAQILAPYGKTWRALDTGYDGYHNGSMVEATVEFGLEIEDDLDQDFRRWLYRDGPFYEDVEGAYSYELPHIQHMLQWLCNEQLIESGKYVVDLWW